VEFRPKFFVCTDGLQQLHAKTIDTPRRDQMNPATNDHISDLSRLMEARKQEDAELLKQAGEKEAAMKEAKRSGARGAAAKEKLKKIRKNADRVGGSLGMASSSDPTGHGGSSASEPLGSRDYIRGFKRAIRFSREVSKKKREIEDEYGDDYDIFDPMPAIRNAGKKLVDTAKHPFRNRRKHFDVPLPPPPPIRPRTSPAPPPRMPHPSPPPQAMMEAPLPPGQVPESMPFGATASVAVSALRPLPAAGAQLHGQMVPPRKKLPLDDRAFKRLPSEPKQGFAVGPPGPPPIASSSLSTQKRGMEAFDPYSSMPTLALDRRLVDKMAESRKLSKDKEACKICAQIH